MRSGHAGRGTGDKAADVHDGYMQVGVEGVNEGDEVLDQFFLPFLKICPKSGPY